MGAFDSELFNLGFRFHRQQNKEKKVSKKALDKATAIEAMHRAEMPCIGSCGAACPNHLCNAHNGEAYNRDEAYALAVSKRIWWAIKKKGWLS